MTAISSVCLALLLACSTLTLAKPLIPEFIGGVRNAASNISADISGHGIAQGSIFIIKGNDLGPEDLAQAAPPYGVRLPDVEGGTEVVVRSLESAHETKAWLQYTWFFQIAAVLPSDFPLGPAEVTVIYNGESSDPVPVNIVESDVGIFTVAMNGRGPAVIQNYTSPTEQPLNQLTTPALPGQHLILWATGLGPISEPDNIAPPVGTVNNNVEVEIAGQRLQPTYAGRAPTFPGVDQINVRLPDDGSIPESCYTEVKVWTGDRASNTVTISTANEPGACKHPWGLPADKLAELDAGGRVGYGEISVARNVWDGFTSASPSARVSASFRSMTAPLVADRSAWIVPPRTQPGCALVTNGVYVGAIIRWVDTPVFYTFPPYPESLRMVYLDAGDVLLMEGPEAKSLPVPKDENLDFTRYSVADLDPDFFTPGEWSVSGLGGQNVGAFLSKIYLPPPVVAELPGTIDRAQPLTIDWNTQGFTNEQAVRLTVTGYRDDAGAGWESRRPVSVSCYVPANAGSVTVPVDVLQLIPADDRGQVSLDLVMDKPEGHHFLASGLDYGVLSYSWNLNAMTIIQ